MVARLLGRRGATIVSPENFMLFTPLLPEAASGTLEPRHVVVPLRQMCPHAELLARPRHRRSTRTRASSRSRREAGAFDVGYDRLVARARRGRRARCPCPASPSTGSASRTSPTRSHLRNHVLRQLEAADAALTTRTHRARHLTFVFVGAGYAGVEALAELADLVRDALRYYPRLRDAPQRWVLVDAAPKILPEIPTRLGEYAARELTGRGIEIHVATTPRARRRRPRRALSDGETDPDAARSSGRPGSSANPLLARARPAARRARAASGRRVPARRGQRRLWALGDCARVPNAATPGTPDPPTSQHALRQARRLARNLRGDPKPYRYRMLGQVATLGRYKGIADVLGVRLRGFPGWFVTRTYHLYQLPLLSRKLRVVVDWTVALFFRRDIAELGTLGPPARRLGD